MVVPCSYCDKSFEEASAFLSHVTYFHADVIATKDLRCFDANCVRTYSTFKSFKKHVLTHTSGRKRQEEVEDQNNDAGFEMNVNVDDVLYDVAPDETDQERELASSEDFDSALANAAVTFCASLYDSDTLTEVQIQNIVESHEQFLSGRFLQILRNDVLDLLNKASNF